MFRAESVVKSSHLAEWVNASGGIGILRAMIERCNRPKIAASKRPSVMLQKLKPFLITAIVAIVAVGLFSRFAPASLKKIVNG